MTHGFSPRHYANDECSPVPLWQLVAVADGLNKAIVTRSELELSLGRLVRAGYVRITAHEFEPTKAALALKMPGPPVANIARAIGAKSWTPGAESPKEPSEVFVSTDAYQQAVKRYRREFWKRYRALRQDA